MEAEGAGHEDTFEHEAAQEALAGLWKSVREIPPPSPPEVEAGVGVLTTATSLMETVVVAVTSPAATLIVPGLVALGLQLGLKGATRGAAATALPPTSAAADVNLPTDFGGLMAR